jgi:broad specificity phosphatase PhoE
MLIEWTMTHGSPFRLAALLLTVATPPSLDAQASTIVFVRHAEKAADTGDPDLSTTGQARAEDLKTALATFPVQAIFVSEYRRTRQTADPTAAVLHVTPIAIAVHGDPGAQAAATAAALQRLAPGSAALVVGHSNTIGPIIAALGGPHVPDLCDAEYATVLVLELTPAVPPRLLRATYGAPDPPQAVACHHEMRLQ